MHLQNLSQIEGILKIRTTVYRTAEYKQPTQISSTSLYTQNFKSQKKAVTYTLLTTTMQKQVLGTLLCTL